MYVAFAINLLNIVDIHFELWLYYTLIQPINIVDLELKSLQHTVDGKCSANYRNYLSR